MGGYAALRLSAALGLDRAVVISPQFTLDPAVVPQDRRYAERQQFDPPLGDLTRHARAGLSGVIVFDPFRPLDRLHAGLIQRLLPGMDFAPLCFGGHPATGAIKAGGAFRALQEIALLPEPLAGRIVALHRSLRAEAATYWQHRAKACGDRGWAADADTDTARRRARAIDAPDRPRAAED